ncbi:MAG: class I SAM-dependent methyltransferase [Planctomycetales bacterium]|nr:class I SAM-dependent methyltransferase [Planctomycetales bacterium]
MVPLGFNRTLQNIHQHLRGVNGWLSDREMEFLALAAACPTTAGDILEIGSFRGRSTIALAHAARLADPKIAGHNTRLHAVDPMLDDDVLLDRPISSGEARREFDDNLSRAGVSSDVTFHQAFSYELAPQWSQSLRLLWIDGDHSYASTKQDYDLFVPHLADGGILAMHDVLSPYDGCIRVFLEEVLPDPHFAAVGLCGSIGWAQFWQRPRATRPQQAEKARLTSKLLKLLPYQTQQKPLRGLRKLHYKWLRSQVPHHKIDAQRWVQQVA